MNVITREELAHIAASAVPAHQLLVATVRCETCKARISVHPLHPHFAYLYRLCDGTLAKIIKPGDIKGGVKKTFGGRVER